MKNNFMDSIQFEIDCMPNTFFINKPVSTEGLLLDIFYIYNKTILKVGIYKEQKKYEIKNNILFLPFKKAVIKTEILSKLITAWEKEINNEDINVI